MRTHLLLTKSPIHVDSLLLLSARSSGSCMRLSGARQCKEWRDNVRFVSRQVSKNQKYSADQYGKENSHLQNSRDIS
jgi:hypothetical protein